MTTTLSSGPGHNDEITIGIAEPIPLARLGLVQSIAAEGDMRIVHSGDTLESLMRPLQEEKIDIGLIRSSFGTKAMKPVLDVRGDASLIVMLDDEHNHPDRVEQLVRLGAQGVLSGRAAIAELLSAIRALHNNPKAYVIPAEVAQMTLQRSLTGRKTTNDSLGRLSPRQREIFQLVGTGLSRTLIAERLGLSVKTISTHADIICKKLGLDWHGVQLKAMRLSVGDTDPREEAAESNGEH